MLSVIGCGFITLYIAGRALLNSTHWPENMEPEDPHHSGEEKGETLPAETSEQKQETESSKSQKGDSQIDRTEVIVPDGLIEIVQISAAKIEAEELEDLWSQVNDINEQENEAFNNE